MPTTSDHKKYTGASSFIPNGRKSRRYKTQINNRRYQKAFKGTKKECNSLFIQWRDGRAKALKGVPWTVL
jgi:hypothetical protein